MKQYEQAYGKFMGFFSTYTPDWIEETFLDYLKINKYEKNMSVKSDKYKIKFEIPSIKKRLIDENKKEEEDVEHITHMQMEIL